MMHIAYRLDRSQKHGIGLFAVEDIPKGALIYTASPILDVNITQAQFDALAPEEQREVRWWGFWVESERLWHVDFDVSRFINHSKDATVTQDPSVTDARLIAARDIRAGEELTQDYREFEGEADLRARGIAV